MNLLSKSEKTIYFANMETLLQKSEDQYYCFDPKQFSLLVDRFKYVPTHNILSLCAPFSRDDFLGF